MRSLIGCHDAPETLAWSLVEEAFKASRESYTFDRGKTAGESPAKCDVDDATAGRG